MIKKLIYRSIIILLFLIFFVKFSFCEEVASPPEGVKILNLSKASAKDYLELKKNFSKINGQIFYAPAGFITNLMINFSGSVISLVKKEALLKVKFNQPVYFYFTKNDNQLFSLDGKKWGGIKDIISGSLSFGFGNTEGKPMTSLFFEINPKKLIK